MLENKSITVRAIKKKNIQFYFALSSILTGFLAALIFPEIVRVWQEDGSIRLLSLFTWEKISNSGFYGIAAGIALTIVGLKFFTSNQMVHLIRLFLITFMLLVSLTYIAFR